jgi:SH3-like domain-containing protein
VTGAPNVDKYSDAPTAWAPKTQDAGIEWLDLKYPRPVHATAVRIRESDGSGAVIKVELFDEQGTAHTAWAGNDPTTDLNYLMVNIPKTAFKTARVKITLATNVIPGWNEIDAVQLVGTDQ